MNRSIIKGTALHKSSVAKAKRDQETLVSQTRMATDPNLIAAAQEYGKSFAPGTVDYTLGGKAKIEAPEVEKKKLKKDLERLDPREIELLETNTGEPELTTSDVDIPDTEFTDRFEDAAEKFGFDLNTVEDYEFAEDRMEYDDDKDEWVLKDIPQEEAISIQPIASGPIPIDNPVFTPNRVETNLPEGTDNDKFFDAAADIGIDIKNADDYARAEDMLEYDEATGEYKRKDVSSINIPTVGVKPIETGGSDDLQLPTSSVDVSGTAPAGGDKLMNAAEKYGLPMDTPEDYARAEELLDYNEETGEYDYDPSKTHDFENDPLLGNIKDNVRDPYVTPPPMEPLDIKPIQPIPTDTSKDDSLIEAPEFTPNPQPNQMAHNNPDYDVKAPEINLNLEGRRTVKVNNGGPGNNHPDRNIRLNNTAHADPNRLKDDLGVEKKSDIENSNTFEASFTEGDGIYDYSIIIDTKTGKESEVWTYNGHEITEDEVPAHVFTPIMTHVSKMQEEQEAGGKKKETTTENILLQNNNKEKNVIGPKNNPIQKRYQSIFNNAAPGGIIQKTMMSHGYTLNTNENGKKKNK